MTSENKAPSDWNGMTCADGSDDIDRKAPFHLCDRGSRVVAQKIMTDRQALDANWKAMRAGEGTRWVRYGDYIEDEPDLSDPEIPVGTAKAVSNVRLAFRELLVEMRRNIWFIVVGLIVGGIPMLYFWLRGEL